MPNSIWLFYAISFLIVLVMTVLLEKHMIPLLTAKARQPIYEGGPSWHMKKSGTPTMGGFAFVICAVTVLGVGMPYFVAVGERECALRILLAVAYALANALIGILDDLTKIRRQKNNGLTPVQKLLLQFGLSALYLYAEFVFFAEEPIFRFSFGDLSLGILYYPICSFLLLGIVNCANLTDGIDGLAASVAFAIGVSLFYMSAERYADVAETAVLLIGCSVGFLIFNLHPAKIFMGDTGSLFLGGLIATGMFRFENPICLIPICAVYVIEGISVVLQVLVFKRTRRRLFLMAPIHHHLEKRGWSENKICIGAMLITLLGCFLTYSLILP